MQRTDFRKPYKHGATRRKGCLPSRMELGFGAGGKALQFGGATEARWVADPSAGFCYETRHTHSHQWVTLEPLPHRKGVPPLPIAVVLATWPRSKAVGGVMRAEVLPVPGSWVPGVLPFAMRNPGPGSCWFREELRGALQPGATGTSPPRRLRSQARPQPAHRLVHTLSF